MPDRIRLRDYNLSDGSVWMLGDALTHHHVRQNRIDVAQVRAQIDEDRLDRRGVDPTMMVGGVAVIDVVGVLSKSMSIMRLLGWSQQPTLAEILEAIEAATADDQVMSILLRINSPGGDVAGTFEVADAVWRARQVKPVHVYAEDLMTSAAYAIGSQAQRITANRTAKVGGIGVFTVVEDASAMAEDIGIKVHVVRSQRLKGAGTRGAELTDEQLAHFQQIVNDLDDVFVRTVQRGRLLTHEAINDMAGGVFVGDRARRRGLIEQVGTVNEAMAALAGRHTSRQGRATARNN